MGLTIHWDIGTNDDLEHARDKMQRLQHLAAGLPLKECSELVDFNAEDIERIGKERGNAWSWALIQAGRFVDFVYDYRHKPVQLLREDCKDHSSHHSMQQNPTRLMGFHTWPGEGCEGANFMLAEYPKTLLVPANAEYNQLAGRLHVASKWRWHTASFCKTCYSKEPVKCHLMVVTILDAAKRIGLDVEVYDEGDYWDKRDVKALAREFGDDVQHLAAFFGVLKDALGDQIVAPIAERPDFEKLEAKGAATPEMKRLATAIKAAVPVTAQPEDN